MPQPGQLLELEQPLLDAYASAWDEVVAMQDAVAGDPANWRRASRLEEMRQAIESRMAQLDDAAEEWVANKLPQAYAFGAADGAVGAGGSFNAWTAIHENAVQNLAQGLFEDLLKATKGVNDSTKQFIREVARDRALSKAIIGKTAEGAGREMQRIIEKNGIHAIKYADGSKHGLREYAQMAMRTTTATAYNTGGVNAAHNLGVVAWECFDGPDCGLTFHEDPTIANGIIGDRDMALTYVISHPNCRRSWSPRPDLTKKDVGKHLGQTTPEQEAAQREQDAARRAAQQRRARRKAKTKGSTPGNAPLQSRLEQRAAKIQQHPTQFPSSVSPPSKAANYVVNGVDYGKDVKSVEQLIAEGFDPDKAIKENKRLKANAASKASKARAKLKAKGLLEDPKATPGEVIAKNADDAAKTGDGEIWEQLKAEQRKAPAGDPVLLTSEAGFRPIEWGDAMSKEYFPGQYVPVHNLRVEGAMVKNGLATRRNGVSYLYEVPDGQIIDGLVKQQFEQQIQTIENAMSVVPEDARKLQKSFAMLRQNNPQDARWAKEYGQANFKSAATGGHGRTTFWDTKPRVSTIHHEFGHTLDSLYGDGAQWITDDKNLWKTLGYELPVIDDVPLVSWETVALYDDSHVFGTFASSLQSKETSPFNHFIESGGANGKPMTLFTGKGVTEYGSTNTREDFAESLRLYLRDKHDGKLGSVDGVDVRFADMFPARAKVFDKALGIDPVNPTLTNWYTHQIGKPLDDLIEKAIGHAGATPDAEDIAAWAKQLGVPRGPIFDKAVQLSVEKRAASLAAEAAKAEAEAAAKRAASKALTDIEKKFKGRSLFTTESKTVDVLTPVGGAKDSLPKNVKASISSKKSTTKKKLLETTYKKDVAAIKAQGLPSYKEKAAIAKLTEDDLEKLEQELVAKALAKQGIDTAGEKVVVIEGAVLNADKVKALANDVDDAISRLEKLRGQSFYNIPASDKALYMRDALSKYVDDFTAEQLDALSGAIAKVESGSFYGKNPFAVGSGSVFTRSVRTETKSVFDQELIDALKLVREQPGLLGGPDDLRMLLDLDEETARKLWRELGGVGGDIPNLEIEARFDAASHRAASSFVNRERPNPAHDAVGGYGLSNPASRAKATIDKHLAERVVDDKQAWIAYEKSKGVSEAKALELFDELGHERRLSQLRTEMSQRVQTWAQTSGDSHPHAIAMQMAIKEEFKTGGDAAVRVSSLEQRAEFERTYAQVGDWYRIVARAMYDNTQEAFAADGIREVAVYRGMGQKAWTEIGHDAATGKAIVQPNLQPANSWSSAESVSKRFGTNMLSATVPVERILGTCRTGFGCLNEKEFVVLESGGTALFHRA